MSQGIGYANILTFKYMYIQPPKHLGSCFKKTPSEKVNTCIAIWFKATQLPHQSPLTSKGDSEELGQVVYVCVYPRMCLGR